MSARSASSCSILAVQLSTRSCPPSLLTANCVWLMFLIVMDNSFADHTVQPSSGEHVSTCITMPILYRPLLGVIELLCASLHAAFVAVTSLDSQSRRSIYEFTIQLFFGCTVVLAPCIIGLRPWAGAAQLLALIFSLNSVANFWRAILKAEKMGGPSLNRWDEAIAFTGCSYLIHAIIRINT
jgi:hypothetical protein